jgi:hypothetical protein
LSLDSTWEVPDVYIMQNRPPKIVLAPGAGFPLRNNFAEHFWSSRDQAAAPLASPDRKGIAPENNSLKSIQGFVSAAHFGSFQPLLFDPVFQLPSTM